MNEIICLDGSGSKGFRPEGIRREMSRWCGPAASGYDREQEREMFREARTLTADLFGADSPDRVVFTGNATQAVHAVISAFMRYGDTALTTVLDHRSATDALLSLTRGTEKLAQEYTFRSRTGWKIVTGFSAAELLEDGRVDYESMRRAAVRKRPAVILCTHASPLTGDLNDLKKVSEIAKEVGAYFIVDAVRTAGIFPVDAAGIGADAVCFSGSIGIPGPAGIGGFVLGQPAKDGRGGAVPGKSGPPDPLLLRTKCEAGSRNLSGMAGYLAAMRYLRLMGIGLARKNALGAASRFAERARGIPGVRLFGCFEDYARAPLVALTLEGCAPSRVSGQLREKYGILTTHGSCGAPLHAKTLGIEKEGAVRFAFDAGCTERDADAAADALGEIADERR